MQTAIKNIAILGSTGSIGRQALDVIRANKNLFQVEVLTAFSNAGLLISQAKEFQPNAVVIVEEEGYAIVKEALLEEDIKVFAGADSLGQVVQMDTVDLVLAAMVGFSGLVPTIKAIEAGKTIALANKETLVVAGELITKLAAERGVNIYPVDSEHSAIFQCMAGEFHNPVEKIILTASGGPFRGMKANELSKVTPESALKHPNWEMGSKITIDSATLMNKGLEVIEAKWLFNLHLSQIEVIIHPQSIIHSIVQFNDGSMKAQMGLPDMKLPIQYALSYPNRIINDFPRFDFVHYPSLTFETPDMKTFRNLQLAYDALQLGGNMPCILNAANEIAVEAFLNHQIKFLDISVLIEKAMGVVSYNSNPGLDEYLDTDNQTREYLKSILPDYALIR